MFFLKKMKLNGLKKKLRRLYHYRQANQVSDTELHKEAQLYLALAKFYDDLRFNKKTPHANDLALANYRAAASLGDAGAHYTLGERLLEQAKFWDSLGRDIYPSKLHHKFASDTYQEAFFHLQAAENQGHAKAKRLRGVAYINGWGVEQNNDQGIELIVESIDQENAWGNAAKIFEDLGLNRPDIFASIMSLRKR